MIRKFSGQNWGIKVADGKDFHGHNILVKAVSRFASFVEVGDEAILSCKSRPATIKPPAP
jgi:hypothetical protein